MIIKEIVLIGAGDNEAYEYAMRLRAKMVEQLNALNEKATVAVIGEGDLPSGRAYINDYMTVVSADEPPAKPTMYEIPQLRRKKWR